jgi:hypothetical protein
VVVVEQAPSQRQGNGGDSRRGPLGDMNMFQKLRALCFVLLQS